MRERENKNIFDPEIKKFSDFATGLPYYIICSFTCILNENLNATVIYLNICISTLTAVVRVLVCFSYRRESTALNVFLQMVSSRKPLRTKHIAKKETGGRY